MDIKPIETVYNGYRFRSRLEARWAVFFTALDIEWQYEPEGLELSDGTRWLPDFYLPDFDTYVEVKADTTESIPDIERIAKFIYWGSAVKRILILSTIPDEIEDPGLWHFPCLCWSGIYDCVEVDWFFFSAAQNEDGTYRHNGHIGRNTYPSPFCFDNNGKVKTRPYKPWTLSAKSDWILRGKAPTLQSIEDAMDYEMQHYYNGTVFKAITKARQARFEHGEKPE